MAESQELIEEPADTKFLLTESSPPFVVCGALQSWPAAKWSVSSLAKILGQKLFPCRLMPRERHGAGPAWESEGVYIDCCIQDFLTWSEGHAKEDNPMYPFSPQEFSGYIDYKYMTRVFEECEHILEEVCWSTLGLRGIDGRNSTMWIGSAGASTPCHRDSYGFNLVAQIQGRKTWVLFPPGDSGCLYPTRIPYEESSIFSQVDITRPNIMDFPRFKESRPFVVTLEPGHVLYVPRHWWHYVVCTETALSINTWVETPEDVDSRMHEAMTRCLASCLIPYFAQTAGDPLMDQWVNPTEDLEAAASNVSYLQTALKHLHSYRTGSSVSSTEQGDSDRPPHLSPSSCFQVPANLSTKTNSVISPEFITTRGNVHSEDMAGEQPFPNADGSHARTRVGLGLTSFQPRLLQLAEFLKDCSFCSVNTPFTWSEFIKEASSKGRFEAEQSTDKSISANDSVEIASAISTGLRDKAGDADGACKFQPRKKFKNEDIGASSDGLVLENRDTLSAKKKPDAPQEMHISQMHLFVLEPCNFEEYLDAVEKACHLSSGQVEQTRVTDSSRYKDLTTCFEEAVLKSVLHPDVVELIIKKLQENCGYDT